MLLGLSIADWAMVSSNATLGFLIFLIFFGWWVALAASALSLVWAYLSSREHG
jgi:hypothetical protein